jgi:hypothetical protein
MKEAMRDFFQLFVEKWKASGQGLPKAPWDPDIDDLIWASPPDEHEWAEWLPREKSTIHDIKEIAPDLDDIHESIIEYFNSWWFCSLEGQLGEYLLMLEPVIPAVELDSFLSNSRNYKSAHGGELNYVPIGSENEGLIVVVDNIDGRVFLENYETSRFDPLAESLEELIRSLKY